MKVLTVGEVMTLSGSLKIMNLVAYAFLSFLFFFFLSFFVVEISSLTLIPLFAPELVHSGSSKLK